MVCSKCGVAGHNVRTCGVYNKTTIPKSSAYYGEYKSNVQKQYNYAKSQKKQSGKTTGAVFKKTKTKDLWKGYTFQKSSYPSSNTFL